MLQSNQTSCPTISEWALTCKVKPLVHVFDPVVSPENEWVLISLRNAAEWAVGVLPFDTGSTLVILAEDWAVAVFCSFDAYRRMSLERQDNMAVSQ